MAIQKYDLIVIGGGPGGYSAAIRGSQKGLKTILVEQETLGGTCLNRGCIPTKTLLHDTEFLTAVRNSYFLRGDMKINLQRIIERKNMVMEGSRGWVQNIITGNNIIYLQGEASFTNSNTIELKSVDGELKTLSASNIILATGATVHYGEGLQTDGESIWSTNDAIALKSIPRTLAVIGAGNRGVELAQIYQNLGSKVVIIEKEKNVLPKFDWDLASRYKKCLLDRKLNILIRSTLVSAIPVEGSGVVLKIETAKGKIEQKVEKVLLTGQRQPDYKSLNLKATGLSLKNRILDFDSNFETDQKGIYVIGDATGPPFLAHKAIQQGMYVIDHILGNTVSQQQIFCPNCVYGDPEVASVGLSEIEAEESGYDIKVGEFRFVGNGRSGSINNDTGLVTIISESDSKTVLGVQIIGPQATELISLACLVMQNGIDLNGIKKTVFSHPSLAESFFEAALNTDGEAIHLLNDN